MEDVKGTRKKRRAKGRKNKKVEVESPKVEVKKVEEKKTEDRDIDIRVPFSAWFSSKVRKGELNFWQSKEILIFMKHKGLKELENPKRYDEILNLY